MGFMTIVWAIPPIVDGHATVRDADDKLSVVCYWVLPFVALGLAMLVTSKYPDWFIEASGGEAEPGLIGSPDTLATPVDDAGGPVVHLEPAAVLADETAAVRITSADPGTTVNLSAETIDAFGHRWRSTATATADAKGTVELADPNTLIWSMRFDLPLHPAG
jgi:hypothetical protein